MLPDYLLLPHDGQLTIIHIPSGCSDVGVAYERGGKYHVAPTSAEGKTTTIVGSASQIIPALLDYCEKHPAPWEDDGAGGYVKWTHFGDGMVELGQSGLWTASRNDGSSLLKGGKPASFATAEEAQRAVDVHLGDDLNLPGFETIDDGFTWEPDPVLLAMVRYLRLWPSVGERIQAGAARFSAA